MPFEDRPWSAPTLGDFGGNVNAYCSACLIDLNTGDTKTAGNCKLPVKREPGAPFNKNAMRAAAGVLQGARGGVDAPPDAKRAAARRLVGMMREAQMTPGDGMMRMAGMM